MRLPQVGQSLRSFWASWPHHEQKRRFSTAHGSREAEGASGSTFPTTSSGSSVSRSRYTSPGCASITTALPLAGLRSR